MTTLLALTAVTHALVGTPRVPVHDSTTKTRCMTHVKQLCLATLMHAADNKDKFSVNSKSFRAKLTPYVRNKDVFTCPLDKPGTNSYTFNETLTGHATMTVKRPAETVMFYEGKNQKPSFRHDGRAVVGFCDGHVRALLFAGGKRLTWKP